MRKLGIIVFCLILILFGAQTVLLMIKPDDEIPFVGKVIYIVLFVILQILNFVLFGRIIFWK